MENDLLDAAGNFITARLDTHGGNAPRSVQDTIMKTGLCLDNLEKSLDAKQKQLYLELENALCEQSGEEIRYYYMAGFQDAVRLLTQREWLY